MRAGAALSLSGRFANQGRQARRGLLLWAEDVNAAGGLLQGPGGARAPIELLIHDDQSRSQPAAELTERLIVRERVDLLFGPYSSVLTLAAAPVAERHARVLWNHGGSSDALAQLGFRYPVSLLAPASRYFVGLLEMARATRPAARRVALAHGAGGTFPRAVIDGAETYARQHGFEIVRRSPYPAEAGGMARLVEEILACRPDLILGAGTTESDLEFARRLKSADVERRPAGLVAAAIELFGQALGAEADGFFGPSQWEPAVEHRPEVGPTSAEFVTRFRQRFGVEPDYPAAQAYAAGLVAVRCAEVAGTWNDAALLEVARCLELTTFYGGFRLDPSTGQQVGHTVLVMQWQDGIKRVVWPPEVASARPRWPGAPP